MVTLVQFRAYGHHVGEHSWPQTLTAFERGLAIKVHPDKFPGFVKRGEQYTMFVRDGVGLSKSDYWLHHCRLHPDVQQLGG